MDTGIIIKNIVETLEPLFQGVTHAMELKMPRSPMAQYLAKTEAYLEGRGMIDMIFRSQLFTV